MSYLGVCGQYESKRAKPTSLTEPSAILLKGIRNKINIMINDLTII